MVSAKKKDIFINFSNLIAAFSPPPKTAADTFTTSHPNSGDVDTGVIKINSATVEDPNLYNTDLFLDFKNKVHRNDAVQQSRDSGEIQIEGRK